MHQAPNCQVRPSGQNNAAGYDSISKTPVMLSMTNFIMNRKLAPKLKADEVFVHIYSQDAKKLSHVHPL